jgi:predicted MFS family arabinose efflux permease
MATAPASGSLRVARATVSAVFFLTGAGFANWVVRIPAVQERLGLGAGALGVALLGVAVGALVAMPLTGRAVARRGSRPVTRVSALAFAATLALPPLAPNLALLTLALVALGAANGALDVAMNGQAAAVERQYGRPIMASFHALFSFGGLVGAALGGTVAAHGIGPAAHLAATAVAVCVAAVVVAPGMLPARADATPDAPPFARPTRALLALGVVAFCVLFGEGAMADWSAVYLRDVTGAGPGFAAAGFATFSLMMAAGRSVGDALTIRVGAARLVRAGGTLAALGLVVAVVVANPWAAVVGFGAVGAGLSIVFPSVLAAAGRLPGGAPGAAIAAVSTFGYTGFLAGPPVIGLVGEALTLRAGLAVVIVASVAVAVLAGSLRRSPEVGDAIGNTRGAERTAEYSSGAQTAA